MDLDLVVVACERLPPKCKKERIRVLMGTLLGFLNMIKSRVGVSGCTKSPSEAV